MTTDNPSILRRAALWATSKDTGMSSECLCRVMLGGEIHDRSAPSDAGDLGRCLRLLDTVPEWKPRIGEMAAISPEWEALVQVWDRLAALMDEEVGIDWSKGKEAPRTYAAMKDAVAHVTVWSSNGYFGFPNEEVRADHAKRHGVRP